MESSNKGEQLEVIQKRAYKFILNKAHNRPLFIVFERKQILNIA